MNTIIVFIQYLLPHHGLSRLVGRLACSRLSWIRKPFIFLFMRYFKVGLSDAEIQDYRQFEHFNGFFTRQLQPGSRPLPRDKNLLVSPADGTVSQLGQLQDGLLLQAKKIDYSVTDLLGGDPQDAAAFHNGSFLTVYLSPRDYHRVHMPVTGSLQKTIYVPGRLFSVNQRTTERVNGLFTRNERLVCLFDTPVGPMAMVLVGAMIVAGIETTWAGKVCPNGHGVQRLDFATSSTPGTLDSAVQLERGAEMGRFYLGSTVVLVFGPDALVLDPELRAGDRVRQGERFASPVAAQTMRR